MATQTIPGYRIEAEIFSTGEWNGDTFTEADLVEIADNFALLRQELKPPLKFGHDEGQTLLRQSDGDPALGWVERLRVAGDKLVATFVGVPKVVYDAIRARRYRRVSAELYLNLRRHGERCGKALKAVALLGADLPAVTNLEDLTAFLTERPRHGLQVGDSRAYTLELTGGAPHPLPTEESPMTDLSTASPPDELQELRAYKAAAEADRERSRAEAAAQAHRAARAEALAFCEEQVALGRMAPRLRERLARELRWQPLAFAEGAGAMVPLAWVRDFVQTCGPVLPQGEVAFAGGEGDAAPPAGAANPSEALGREASLKMMEMHCTYGQAAAYVLKTNPALAKAYRAYTLNPS